MPCTMSKDEFSQRWDEYSQLVSVKPMKDLLEVIEIRTVDLPSPKQPEQEALTLPAGVSPLQLMNNQVECYWVIIVLRRGGSATREILCVTLPHVKALANSEWGTWLLQDFFNVFHWNDPAMVALVNKLKPHTAEFLLSKHAHSVLKKMVLTLPPGMLDFIIETIDSEGAVELAKDQYASRVIQGVVERYVKLGMEDRLANVLDKITCAAPELSREEFGNYIIQAILSSARHRNAIMQNLRGHWTQLASRFFVVQALLSSSQGKVKKGLRNELDLAVGQLTLVERALANGTAEDLRDCAIDVSNFEEASPRRPAPPIAAAAKAPEFSGGGGGGGRSAGPRRSCDRALQPRGRRRRRIRSARRRDLC
mmetsp:Transcript_136219/g.344940  ORF Transcript_136219/g.344940 Transcript_136219/m.344940 type:complete len:366 (+) Transcript_136219:54-1151(+)